jgi:hypothetical protein
MSFTMPMPFTKKPENKNRFYRFDLPGICIGK